MNGKWRKVAFCGGSKPRKCWESVGPSRAWGYIAGPQLAPASDSVVFVTAIVLLI